MPIKFACRKMIKRNKYLLSFILSFVFCIHLFSQKGKDGPAVINANGAIFNRYTTLAQSAVAGASQIVVASTSSLESTAINGVINNPYSSGSLEGCDLIMIIKMQGASINTTNTNAYGTINSYNGVGDYELFEIGSVINNTISLASGCVLNKSYLISSGQRVQVVRIPRLTSLTINNGGSLVSQAWGVFPGCGGVVAIETTNAVIINGTISTQGQGFRGGSAQIATSTPSITNYVSTLNGFGGEKGEGIAGSQLDYDILNGRYARGAPANGGGGGNSDNAGGGGGSNAGNLAGYTGTGIPDNSFVGWTTSWNIESASFASSTSPGGGRGGYSKSLNNANALVNPPSDILWGGDQRSNIGGFGGRPLNYAGDTKLFFGGGGGAGHGDNGHNLSGANGGGIIYLISDGTVSGSGLITSNGNDAQSTIPSHADAPGGGGGGGAITIFSKVSVTGLIISSRGGNGGNQQIITNEAEGPGGGGSGGYILTTTSSALTSVSGGGNGITSSAGLTEFLPNGATKGDAGTIVNNVPYLPVSSRVNLGITITGNVAPLCLGGQKTYTVTVNNIACSPASSVLVNIPAPSGVTFTSATANSGTYSAPNWSILSIPPFGTVTIVLTGIITATNIAAFGGTVTSASPECITINNATTAPSFTVIDVQITAVAIPTVICLGSIATLSANGATTYTWNPGNLTGSTTTVSPNATTIYTVTGNISICFGSQTVQLVVNPIPTLNATAAPTLICPGGTATLNATGALTYTWFPGPLVGATQTVVGFFPTQYTVFGTDANGCSSYAIVQLPVFIPTISAFPSVICIGESSTLTAFGGISYTWTPGNIISPTLVVTPTVSTGYTVTGTHISGCIAYTVVFVTVWPIPTVNVIATPTRICVGQPSTLTAWGALTYFWPAPLNTAGSPVVVSPTVTTTYTVIGYTINNCADTATVQVIVDPNPTVTAIPNPLNICRGGSSTLTAFGALTYTWAPPPTGIVGTTIVVSPTVTSQYTVVGTNTFGCKDIGYVTVFVGPNITAIAIPTVICAGETSTLIATGALTYTWQPPNLNGASITVTPTSSGFYTVTATDPFGCKDSLQVYVQVNPTPTITATINPSVVCAGQQITLTATGANSFAWMPGGFSTPTATFFATSSTIYTVVGTNIFGCKDTKTVELTVNNCTLNVPIGLAKKVSIIKSDNFEDYYITITFVVKNYATFPIYNVQITDNLANTFPSPTTFTVIPSPISVNNFVNINSSYTGLGSNTDLLISATSSLLPGQVDTIKVNVRFSPNGLNSFTNSAMAFASSLPTGGFSGSDVSTDGSNPDPNGDNDPLGTGESIPSVFEIEFDFFIPQGFSPNGDQVNDFFEIRGIKFYPDNEIKIINRWGNIVYQKKGYANTWDGTATEGIEIGGNKLPEGTYYYILDIGNNKKPFTGFLYLNRGLSK